MLRPNISISPLPKGSGERLIRLSDRLTISMFFFSLTRQWTGPRKPRSLGENDTGANTGANTGAPGAEASGAEASGATWAC
jgi:hypothetical protein